MTIEFSDLWAEPRQTNSYWVLLLARRENPKETQLAYQLAFWKEFYSQYRAKTRIFERKDAPHRELRDFFDISDLPVLVTSHEPGMEDHVVFRPDFLFRLLPEQGDFIEFLDSVHEKFQRGQTATDLRREIRSRNWKALGKLAGTGLLGWLTKTSPDKVIQILAE